MFTRIVECYVKREKADEFRDRIKNLRADADRYHRDHFEQILNSVRPLLIDEPSIEFYNVEASTVHRFAAGRAA